MTEPLTPFTPVVNETGTDFFSDEPLACPLDREDGEPCEGCQ